MFNECMIESVQCMEKRIHTGQKRETRKWFDDECCIARKNVRKQLRKFRKSLSPSDRFAYKKLQREYKNLLKQKKKQHKDKLFSELLETMSNQQDFWKKMNEISPRRTRNICNIPIDSWYSHFKSVLEEDN